MHRSQIRHIQPVYPWYTLRMHTSGPTSGPTLAATYIHAITTNLQSCTVERQGRPLPACAGTPHSHAELLLSANSTNTFIWYFLRLCLFFHWDNFHKTNKVRECGLHSKISENGKNCIRRHPSLVQSLGKQLSTDYNKWMLSSPFACLAATNIQAYKPFMGNKHTSHSWATLACALPPFPFASPPIIPLPLFCGLRSLLVPFEQHRLLLNT